MPNGQDTYVRIPDGSFVRIPANATPQQLQALREKLAKLRGTARPSEAQQAAELAPKTQEQARKTAAGGITSFNPGREAFPKSVPVVNKGESEMSAELDPRNRFADPAEVLRQASAANAPEPRPQGFWRNMLWDEPKAIAKGLFSYPEGVAGFSPPNITPTTKAIEAVKQDKPGEAALAAVGQIPAVGGPVATRAEQAGTDPWGAAGASITDIVAMALPFFLGSEKGVGDVTAKQGASHLANAISEQELSPAQYGRQLQEGFDVISSSAGAAKGEVLKQIEQLPNPVKVTYANTIRTLETWVSNLKTLQSRNPRLFSQGEAMNKTLDILEQELAATKSEASAAGHPELPTWQNQGESNLSKADARRTQYFNYRLQLDPSLAKRVVQDLNRSLTQDVGAGIKEQSPSLADAYLRTSNRYKEIQDLARDETLKKVFSSKRVTPDKVTRILSTVPEESIRAIRKLYMENPQDVQQLRRSLFEYGFSHPQTVGGLFRMSPSLTREIFGPQAEAVNSFIEAINPSKAPKSALLRLVPGKPGAIAQFVVASAKGGQDIVIPASEMSKILKSANMTRLWTQAAEVPADSGPGRYMRNVVLSSMVAMGMKPAEKEAVQ
jgi:hypothetical protein